MNAGRMKSRERGVAAIEFALVFVLLFSVLYAVATFGAVFYMQQAVTRAAEEGARAAGLVTAPANNDQRVKDAVYAALANSLVVPAASNASVATRRSWIESKVVVTAMPAGAGATASYVVTVSYPYSENRLLPTMPLLDLSTWVPNQLRSRSTIALRS
ncbi:pilus assembly protein [Variovorax sp. ZS18.2.2]|uniref:TadE/TadG family type IV pilus assembly protein n=1 Tax=Variovorax sp. ZS18.2.2 TaxID=2971255 RepID=UPI002151F01D|nr:TadE/TadG family type IV pilus assembly protein [Variovorax sp. ZS18.2.2]MCR6479716.1 pilus assembly protein [Variovorax sp. ZS18.2.2]